MCVMTDDGTSIRVDEAEATIGGLLKAVWEQGRTVHILSHGEPVAALEVLPLKPRHTARGHLHGGRAGG